MDFKNYLKKNRIKSGYTQTSLAAKLKDVTPQYISSLERCEDLPSAKMFLRLCVILNLSEKSAKKIFLKEHTKIIEKKIIDAKKNISAGAQINVLF